MINTFYSTQTLDTPQALIASLLIGMLFGFALERGGFGSSRRLCGIFYFRDMSVLKVMFTALIVGMLGLSYARGFGLIGTETLFLLPSHYTAQILGGLIFGIGFVMGGWCPGTAAVGLASGKMDALLFLLGAIGGSILYNETFSSVASLGTSGASVSYAYQSLGLSEALFAFFFTLIAVGCFWGSEQLEHIRNKTPYQNTRFLSVCSACLITAAAGLFAFDGHQAMPLPGEQDIVTEIQAAEDHLEPEELADIIRGGGPVIVVDIRTPAEYNNFHIRTALNIQLPELAAELEAYKEAPLIVLYSNGMTHPAQARDSLVRQGFKNVRHLTDGLEGFKERCLKPLSLRNEPLPEDQAAKIKAWQQFFIP